MAKSTAFSILAGVLDPVVNYFWRATYISYHRKVDWVSVGLGIWINLLFLIPAVSAIGKGGTKMLTEGVLLFCRLNKKSASFLNIQQEFEDSKNKISNSVVKVQYYKALK